jgi:fumarate reductase flavoprotein subunit
MVAFDVNCTGLIANEAGGVVGAVVDSGKKEYVRAAKVILACNGFAGNKELLARYIPEMVDALYFGGAASTGEGILWGMALGAEVAFMDAYQAHASVAMPGEMLVPYGITTSGGFHVNAAGRRFADETHGYSEHALAVLQQDGAGAYLIFDESCRQVGLTFQDYRECEEAHLIHSGPSLSEVATKLRLDPAPVERTFAEYQASRAAGHDEFGRTTFADLKPPFYGVRITGALFHTQGGLQVDRDARVLRTDGSPIANLYAGGGVAAGICGHGAGGYFSGAGLLTAVGYGYLAGRHAAGSLSG